MIAAHYTLGKFHFVAQTGIKKIDELLKLNPEKFKIIMDPDKKIWPYIGCTECKQFWFCYKWNNGQVRTNSRSNYINHKCNLVQELVRIDHSLKENLSKEIRNDYIQFLAKTLPKFPTISLNAGVELANKIANYSANISFKTKRNFKYDGSRQTVSQSILSQGNDIMTSNKNLFFEHYDEACLILDHWSCHGRSFIGIIARMLIDNEIVERVVEFKDASNDKSSYGIFQDFAMFTKESKFPLPIITDNCRTMVSLSKHSKFIFKVFCLEHKLAIIESKLHKNSIFKKIDDKITLINAFFSYRHMKYDLSLKPPTSFSQTRPWRSNRLNYRVFIQNYDSYVMIQASEANFPEIPALFEVQNLYEFEKQFCENFDILEKTSSDMLDGVTVYFNLIKLARTEQFQLFNLEETIIQELYPIVFAPVSFVFYCLSRVNWSCKFLLNFTF